MKILQGTASLVKKTVFGLTDTITKISSSIGEGERLVYSNAVVTRADRF